MREVIQTGKTIEEALEKAILELNVDRDEVEYEILETPTSGFLGFGAKPAKIVARCDVRKPVEQVVKTQRPAAFKKTEPVKREIKKDTPPVSVIKKEEQVDEAFVPSENAVPFVTGFLKELFEKMSFQVEVTVESKGKFIEVNLKGEDVGSVIGKHGDTLDSVQHITQLAFNKAVKGAEKVRIDTEGYRDKREKTLVGLARSIANRVIKSKGKYELEPMKAYERRIIHAALQSYPMLTTYSVGNEPQRRIVIAFKHK